jgi:hypothetical protein
MNAEQFRDIFHVLHNIDMADLQAAGIINTGMGGAMAWSRFNNDIGTFVLKLRQENLEALFELVRSRMAAGTDSPTHQCDEWPGCACGRGGPDLCAEGRTP